jgi:hypothetical protein
MNALSLGEGGPQRRFRQPPRVGSGVSSFLIVLSKVGHSERSEESALVRSGMELQILRSAQDDSDFQLRGWV